MVKLTQIDDENVANPSVPKTEVNEEDYEDTSESEVEEDSDDEDIENETVYDRIVALRDIIPPTQRLRISDAANYLYSFASLSTSKLGDLLWIVSTSAILLGTPLALSILSERQLAEMEKEYKLQQDSALVLAPGSDAAFDNALQQPVAWTGNDEPCHHSE